LKQGTKNAGFSATEHGGLIVFDQGKKLVEATEHGGLVNGTWGLKHETCEV